jgi:hypothetical protein
VVAVLRTELKSHYEARGAEVDPDCRKLGLETKGLQTARKNKAKSP